MEAWANTRSTKHQVVSFNIYKTGFILKIFRKIILSISTYMVNDSDLHLK